MLFNCIFWLDNFEHLSERLWSGSRKDWAYGDSLLPSHALARVSRFHTFSYVQEPQFNAWKWGGLGKSKWHFGLGSAHQFTPTQYCLWTHVPLLWMDSRRPYCPTGGMVSAGVHLSLQTSKQSENSLWFKRVSYPQETPSGWWLMTLLQIYCLHNHRNILIPQGTSEQQYFSVLQQPC